MAGPMTEASNPITFKMDLASPEEMVRLFQRCDQEVFHGPENCPDLQENSLIKSKILQEKIEQVATLIKSSKSPLVVFSGCGTSGRLGYLAKVTFKNSNLLDHAKFEYLIAGGDKALLTSQEAHEDKPLEGISDLENCIAKVRKESSFEPSEIILIAITCGMSAPYCAGQLDLFNGENKSKSKNLPNLIPVLISFNKLENARKIPIPTWDNRTFHEVAQNLAKSDKAIIINPTLGGEHLTGSSRMKGGSATKAILDAIFLTAVIEKSKPLDHFLNMSRKIDQHYLKNCKEISRLINLGGQALLADPPTSITYFGNNSEGAIAMIDGTECKPTFGATLNDVRGFIQGGFKNLQNNENDISHYADEFKVDFSDYNNLTSKGLLKTGMAVCFSKPIDGSKFTAPDCLSLADITSQGFDLEILENDGSVEFYKNLLLNQLLVKLSLNCISTGSHVLKGKVMHNFMIDVALTNLKLLHRGQSLIQKFIPGISENSAKNYLLKGIYNVTVLTPEILSQPDQAHVAKATTAAVEIGNCVPVAIILAAYGEKKGQKDFPVEEARRLLQSNPRCRQVLTEILS